MQIQIRKKNTNGSGIKKREAFFDATFHAAHSTLRANAGFTLVEVMVATAIFVVVMVMGIGAVLNTNASHKETQSLHTIIDNLNFVMEDMSRNLRLGESYHCQYLTGTITDPADCPLSAGVLSIAFEKQGGDTANAGDQVVYNIHIRNAQDVFLEKSTDSGATFYPITPDNPDTGSIKIDPIRSGFVVVGSNPTDHKQPLVIIRLAGTIDIHGATTPFNLETSVSQRAIDGGL